MRYKNQKSTIPQANQILNINSVTPISWQQNILLPVTQIHPSNLTCFKHRNLYSKHATRLQLTQNNSTLARPNPNHNFIPFNCTNFDSQHASRLRLTQNQLAPAQHNNTLESISPNHTIFDCDLDPGVHLTQTKLSPAGHNSHLLTQPHATRYSNASFAIQASKH